MPRPQFTLRALLVAMLVVAIGSATLPRPIQSLRRWLWPLETFPCTLTISHPIIILEEDEALLDIPETP